MNKKTTAKPILLRVPVPMLKRIDSAAQKKGRSRTAEICIRLADSLKKRSDEAAA